MRRTGGLDELTASKRNLLVSRIVGEFQELYEGNAAELEDEVRRLENEVFHSATNVEQYFALMGSRSITLKAQLVSNHDEAAERVNTPQRVRSMRAAMRAEGGATTEGMAEAPALEAAWLKAARGSRATTEFWEEGAGGDSTGVGGGGAAGATGELHETAEAGGRSPADQAGSDSAEGSCTAPASAAPQKPSGGITSTFGGDGDLASAISSRRQFLAQNLPRLQVSPLVADPDPYQSPFPHGYEGGQYDALPYTGAYGVAPATLPNSGQTSPHQGFGMSLARLNCSGDLPHASGTAGAGSFPGELGGSGVMPSCSEVPLSQPSAQPPFEQRSDLEFDVRPMSAQRPDEIIFTRRSGPPKMCLSPGANGPTTATHFAHAPTTSRATMPNPSLPYPTSMPDFEPLCKEPPAIYRSSSTPGSSASWLPSNAALPGGLAQGRMEAMDAIRQQLVGDIGGVGDGDGGGGYGETAGFRGAQALAPSSFLPTTGPQLQQQQLQHESWLMAPSIATPRQQLHPSALNDSHQQQAVSTGTIPGVPEPHMAPPAWPDWPQALVPSMEMRSAAPAGMQLPPYSSQQQQQQPQKPQLQRHPSAAGMSGPSGVQPPVPRALSSTALHMPRPAQLPPLAPRPESSWQAPQQPLSWSTHEARHQSGSQAVASGRQAKSPPSSMQKRSPLGSAVPPPWEDFPVGGGADPSGSAPPSVKGHSSGAAATSLAGLYGQYDNMEQLVAQQAQEVAAAAAASVAAAVASTDARSTDFSMRNATATDSTNDDAGCMPTAGPTRPSPAFLRASWTSGYPQIPSVRPTTPQSLSVPASVPASIRGSSWSGDASTVAALAATGTSAGGTGMRSGDAYQPPPPLVTDRYDMQAFPRQYPHQRPSQPAQNFYQPQSQDPERMQELVHEQLMLWQQGNREAAGPNAQPPAWSRDPPPPLRTVSADWCGSLSVTASQSPYNSSCSPSPYRSQAHSSLIGASSSSLGMNGLSLGLSTGGTTSGSDVWEAAQARGGAAGGGGGNGTSGRVWGLGRARGSRQGDLANAVPDPERPLLPPSDAAPDSPGLFKAYPQSPVASPPSAPFGHHMSSGRQRTSMEAIFGGLDAGTGGSWMPNTGGVPEVRRVSVIAGQNTLHSHGGEAGAGGGQEGATAGHNDGGDGCYTLERDVSLSRGMAAGPEGAGSGGGMEAGPGSNGGNADGANADADDVFGIGLNPLPDAMPDIALGCSWRD